MLTARCLSQYCYFSILEQSSSMHFLIKTHLYENINSLITTRSCYSGTDYLLINCKFKLCFNKSSNAFHIHHFEKNSVFFVSTSIRWVAAELKKMRLFCRKYSFWSEKAVRCFASKILRHLEYSKSFVELLQLKMAASDGKKVAVFWRKKGQIFFFVSFCFVIDFFCF